MCSSVSGMGTGDGQRAEKAARAAAARPAMPSAHLSTSALGEIAAEEETYPIDADSTFDIDEAGPVAVHMGEGAGARPLSLAGICSSSLLSVACLSSAARALTGGGLGG